MSHNVGSYDSPKLIYINNRLGECRFCLPTVTYAWAVAYAEVIDDTGDNRSASGPW